MEQYLNLFEHIPEDEHNHISNKIWESLDRAGIELSQDAELSIRIYDDNLKQNIDVNSSWEPSPFGEDDHPYFYEH